jgi:hypothetical protein
MGGKSTPSPEHFVIVLLLSPPPLRILFLSQHACRVDETSAPSAGVLPERFPSTPAVARSSFSIILVS